MYFVRKSLFLVTLVGALFGSLALASVQVSGSQAGGGHLSLMRLATLPSRVRLRRSVRRAKTRVTALWDLLHSRDTRIPTRARGEFIRPRLLSHDWYARGPPRAVGS
jgi:hypothetical protein